MTHADRPHGAAEFAALPLEAQRAELDRALDRGDDPRELFAQCAALRDHAPLVHLTGRLVGAGRLGDPATRAWFAHALAELPETTVHHVLKALVARVHAAPVTAREQLAAVLVEAVRVAPLAQLSALCVIDRALKQHFPERREHYVGSCVDRCAEVLRREEQPVGELPLALLAQVPAADHAALRALAAAHGGPARAAEFDVRRAELAAECIAVLGRAPKALSQSNAEELLARRVYTDPGHFLVELLQNAEDAQARTFRVVFDAGRIVVHHDGVPFDARDLVGVTSIGQTTKRRQQIGFFGVGFKSVYEVTERPQIYSDVYRFEIVDVSVPRPLAARPHDLPPDGTLLVLPLREGLAVGPGHGAARDAARSPAALFAKARALDPCVLLTLRSLRAIELELTAAAGGPARAALRATGAAASPTDGGPALVAVAREPEGAAQTYAVQDDEFRYPGTDREAGRPDRTRVMVGVATDARGVPRPLPPGSSTVYSYLPTNEPSGLRFFVQGHFDVPVDRERIAPESAWNRWILGRVPEQLARLAAALTEIDAPGEAASAALRAERAAALLDVLPLPTELPSPALRAVADALPVALADVQTVPGADGALHRAADALLAPPRLVALFDGGRLPAAPGASARAGDDGARWFAAPETLGPRAREVARALGAREFDTAALVAWLERALARPHAAPPPLRALRGPSEGEFEDLFALYELLSEELDRARDAGGPPAEHALATRLRALPIVPDPRGALRAAASGLVRGEPALRAVAARAFVHPRLDDAPPPPGDEPGARAAPSRAAPLLDRLGVPRLTAADLLAELARALERAPRPLTVPAAEARLAGGADGGAGRLDAALGYLAAAPWDIAVRAARLPVFRATDGALHPAASAPHDRAGVLVVPPGATGERLREFYGAHARPLAAARADEPAGALLARVSAPALGVDVLLTDVARGDVFAATVPSLRALHALLEALRDELSARARAQLAALPIWPDRRGAARPLRGAGAVYVAASDAVAGLLPEAPLLDPEVAARAHLALMDPVVLGPDAVIAALAPSAAPPVRFVPSAPRVEALHAFLAEHAPRMGRDALDRVLDAPIYPAAGTLALGPLGDVRGGPLDPRYRYPCEPDVRGVLAAAGVAVLDADAQARLAPLLAAARVPLAGIDPVIERLRALRSAPAGAPVPALQAPAALREVQALLASHREALARAYPPAPRGPGRAPASPVLCALAIWRTASGGVASADELVDDPRLLAWCAPGTPERATLDAARPADEPTAARLAELAPLLAPSPAARMVAHLVARHARAGAPLAAQPGLLASVERLAAVGAALRAALAASADGREGDGVIRPAHVPLLDARGRVRFDPLRTCDDDETAALLAALPLGGELVHPELLAADPSLRGWTARVSRVTAAEVLSALLQTPPDSRPDAAAATSGPLAAAEHPVLRDAARRARFYRWLATHEREVFADPACRRALAEAPAFLTTRGNLLRPGELVVDPALPDLGIDWRPSDEIPAETLALLARHLGAGRLPPAELIERHLRPAYVRAVSAGAREDAAAILAYLARALRGRPADEVRALLRRPDEPREDLLLEDARGRFHRPEDMVLPPEDLAHTVAAVWGEGYPIPSPARYPAELAPLLADLGVPAAPTLPRVREALGRIAGGSDRPRLRALAALCARMHREHGARVFDLLPLRQSAWVLDGTGCARRPAELFAREPETTALVGDFGELYPDEAVVAVMGERFARQVGLRTAREARLPEVLHHLDARIASGSPVPFGVYHWLERGLAGSSLEPGELGAALASRRWVLCDDGGYRRAREVLGTWAVPYFGARRGYWVRGRVECPRLCQLAGIADAVTPASVAALFAELAAEVARDGDRAVLARDEALPRMWLNGAALLGRARAAVDPAACVVLCSERGADRARASRGAAARGGDAADEPLTGGGGGARALRLVRAGAPNLLRSDTPTLEALFDDVGSWYAAARGGADDRAAVDAFYDALGVRRLREAYAVDLDPDDGGDRSDALAAELAALRGTLRALLAVLPRVRARRAQLPAARWVYDARLRPLAAAGALFARAGLRVRYQLAGVGAVRAAAAAAYDARRGALLVDAAAVADPDAYATELAAALLPCIYDGPGDDALTDVLEILLPLRTRERMAAYLDRRHFPAADADGPSARDRVAERVGELLDFGLHRALAARFSAALADREFDRWRDPAVLAPLDAAPASDPRTGAPLDRTALARRAAPLLLTAIGLAPDAAPPALTETLATLLAASALADAAAALFGVGAAPPPPPPPPPGPLVPPPTSSASPAAPRDAIEPPGGTDAVPPLEDLAARTRTGTIGRSPAFEPPAPAEAHSEDAPDFSEHQGAPGGSARDHGATDPLGAAPTAAAAAPAGVWSRVMRFFGLDAPASPSAASAASDTPGWTRRDANCLAPTDGIGPQLWATPAARQQLAATPPAATLAHEPRVLPAPHLYAVHALGAAFDPRTQRWSGVGAPDLTAAFAASASTGRTVAFRGEVLPGLSVLPVPLWSRLTREGLRAADGSPAPGAVELLGTDPGGALRVRVRGARPVAIAYAVELLEVPPLTTATGAAPPAHAALLAPTLPLRELPGEVRRWVERERAAGRPEWARAHAALRFVRARYAYDDAFLTRAPVRRALAALEPGRGHHHLALMHAAGDGARLGYGICYELNLFVVELLRHLGVPALAATGWALDLGHADRPDHLFALALVPSPAGRCALPLDAATDAAGPIHTLRPSSDSAAAASSDNAPSELEPPPRAPPLVPPLPSVGGPWSFEPATSPGAHAAGGGGGAGGDEDAAWLDALRAAESARLLEEHATLLRAVRLAARARRAAVPAELAAPLPREPAQRAAHVAALRGALDQLLPDRDLAGALLALVRGEYQQLTAVPPRVQELVALGLAQVRTVPAFQVVTVGE